MLIPRHQENALVVAIGIDSATKLKNLDMRQGPNLRRISFLPLDGDYKPYTKMPWLTIDLRKSVKHKNPPGNLIEDWYEISKLRQPIIPLVEDWGLCKSALDQILGYDPQTKAPVSNLYFSNTVRIDLNAIRYFLLDMAGYYGEDYPFMFKPGMSCIAASLALKRSPKVNYYHNCMDLANCYKRILDNFPTLFTRKHQLQ